MSHATSMPHEVSMPRAASILSETTQLSSPSSTPFSLSVQDACASTVTLPKANAAQLAAHAAKFFEASPEITVHFPKCPNAYNILTWIGAVKLFHRCHPYILGADGSPLARIEIKAFYQACLGEDDRASNTVNSHFSDFDRAHDLKGQSGTICHVLAGEGIMDVTRPWILPTDGQAPPAVKVTDFRRLLTWVSWMGADPTRDTPM